MPPPLGPAPATCFIRTKNESRMIGRVVAAAKEAVADVVVIDCGSTDDTVAIAQAAGARVFPHAWLGNGKQKRIGEDNSQYDWVLDLDADEVLTRELIGEIRALFAEGEPKRSIYGIAMITVPAVGKAWVDFAIIDRLKLYDKRAVRAPDHAIWDQFKVPAGVQVGRLNAPIMHHSFRDFEHFMEKLNGYSSALARETAPKPMWQLALRMVFAPPFYFMKHFFGRSLWRAGLYGFAIAGMSANGRWLRDIKMYERRVREVEQARKPA